ncbi:aldo/keto reductase [Haladaptatus sp. GCM10025707]|uniref:aldo/keto reductase n=1 Tax=unclassified Haladaptatus TaxID=2622732 RepID=UPI0023E8522A|nr:MULTISPECIES: aldo/keto reductase [unclassified Haladaptatus]
MESVRLGSTGIKTAPLSLGTWRFGLERDGVLETSREEAHELLDAAYDRGIDFIDTANSYGGGRSEQWIGEWLEDVDREDVVLASKVYWAMQGGESRNLSRKNIRAEIEGSLDRLGTDYLDIYYIHAWDPETPIAETLSVLSDLVREGRVHYLAASNTAAWQLTKALWQSDVHGWDRFEIVQPKFNVAYQESPDEVLSVCADQDLAVCPYSPLEGGFLTGKYERDGDAPSDSRGARESWERRFEDRQWRVLDEVRDIADVKEVTPAQVALRWLIDQEAYTCVPIVGARSVSQLDENVGATAFELSGEERTRLTDAYEGESA